VICGLLEAMPVIFKCDAIEYSWNVGSHYSKYKAWCYAVYLRFHLWYLVF
jgi:hypothetical protein